MHMPHVLIRLGLACLLGLAVLVAGCSKKTSVESSKQVEEEHGKEEDKHGEGEEKHGEEESNHVDISAEAALASGIEVEAVGARDIQTELSLPGEVEPDADRLAHIVPRFPGIVREVRKRLGDQVRQGEVLAVIEGNQSLSNYEVRSLIAGTVIEKHATLGEFVRDDSDVYVVANLSTVWVNISIYARDVARVRRGQPVRIEGVEGGGSAVGKIDYIGSSVGDETRTASARVVLPNPGRRWKPGSFITAHIVMQSASAAIAVPDAALQIIEGKTMVFVKEGDGFSGRVVTIGRTDGKWTEITSGLKAGELIATRGSFVLKSELLKSEAGHGH